MNGRIPGRGRSDGRSVALAAALGLAMLAGQSRSATTVTSAVSVGLSSFCLLGMTSSAVSLTIANPATPGDVPTNAINSSTYAQYSSTVAVGVTRRITAAWAAGNAAPSGCTLTLLATPGSGMGSSAGTITVSSTAQNIVTGDRRVRRGDGRNERRPDGLHARCDGDDLARSQPKHGGHDHPDYDLIPEILRRHLPPKGEAPPPSGRIRGGENLPLQSPPPRRFTRSGLRITLKPIKGMTPMNIGKHRFSRGRRTPLGPALAVILLASTLHAAISITVTGSWSLSITSADLTGAAGSDLTSYYESNTNQLAMTIGGTRAKHLEGGCPAGGFDLARRLWALHQKDQCRDRPQGDRLRRRDGIRLDHDDRSDLFNRDP